MVPGSSTLPTADTSETDQLVWYEPHPTELCVFMGTKELVLSEAEYRSAVEAEPSAKLRSRWRATFERPVSSELMLNLQDLYILLKHIV